MTIEVQIFGRDMEVSEHLHKYVSKRASKLDRYLKGIREVRVDLGYAKTARHAGDRYVAQITLHGKGFTLRSEERTDDIRSAFDVAHKKIQRRIENYKGKRFRVRGDGTSLADDAMEILQVEGKDEETNEIARRKKFLLNPMDEEEALEQMKLLGHEDFFIFLNVDLDTVSVLYRRRDGSYGLINTEMA